MMSPSHKHLIVVTQRALVPTYLNYLPILNVTPPPSFPRVYSIDPAVAFFFPLPRESPPGLTKYSSQKPPSPLGNGLPKAPGPEADKRSKPKKDGINGIHGIMGTGDLVPLLGRKEGGRGEGACAGSRVPRQSGAIHIANGRA